MLSLYLFAPICGFALDPNKDIYQYNCRTWLQQHGLPANGINAITQTKDGYIWLAANSGLVRFDGITFTSVNLARSSGLRSTQITCLGSSSRGGIWFGIKLSSYGYYDGRGNWTLGTDSQGGSDWDVPAILEARDGRLWIGGDKASVRAKNSNQIQPLFPDASPPTYVTCFLQDSQGRIWVGTTGQGLYYLQGEKLVKFPDSSLDPNTITALTQDNDGQLWLGTTSGLICYDSQGRRKAVDAPGSQYRALIVDRNGVLWAGTFGTGLWRYSRGVWSSLRKTDGLADDYVLSLAEDGEGNIWIGTREGLSQLTDVKFPTFGITEGLNADMALSVSASPRGGLWACTPSGATYFDGQAFAETYATNSGLESPYVKRVLEARNGDVFVTAGANEINILANGRLVAKHQTGAMPVAMVEDAQGVVVSVGGDLFRAGRDSLTPYPFTNNAKPNLYWVINMAPSPDGSILVACMNGICRVKDGAFEQWTQGDGLADYQARWVSQDSDGTIWAGLASGIARIRGRQIRNIHRENGLFDADISAFVFDDRGNIWVDSDHGIFRTTRASLNDCADGKTNRVDCVSYNDPASVKPGDKYDQEQSACKTQDGRIWFPSSRGVIMVDPANIQIDRLPPPVHVESIRANGREVVETNGTIIIPPGRGELEFQYTALSYITPRNVRFRYQLEGYDQQWVEAETRRLAAYNNLKPGRYTFRVVACNADNVWNENGASVEIQLRPHFYQTAWFYLLNGALIVASLAGIYAWRISALKSRERVLKLRVEERTAELSETNIALTEEVLHRKRAQAEIEDKKALLENEIEERKRMQSEVERIHRQLMDASREAGQAEVATSVLHNVGNVLNSVNVSVSVIGDRLRGLRVANIAKAAALLQEHDGDLGHFLTQDKKGRHLPKYLEGLGQDLKTEQADLLKELYDLAQNVEHIKDIVAMQQTYAKFAGVTETVTVADLMESAVKMHAGAYVRHGVSLAREFSEVPQIDVDKHKVMQILVNLLHNAKYACDQSGRKDKLVILRIQLSGGQMVKIEVADNGVGIAPENLTRIFSHGFTTRKNGHGFGLHSGALAAKELGGILSVHSDGLGQGATFALELPLSPPNARSRSHDEYDVPAGIGREDA